MYFFNLKKCFPDYSAGFGGKFGVQTDRVDKSALGWEHVEKVEKHESQKGNKQKQIEPKIIKHILQKGFNN